jgi:hypothetical protein
VMWVACGRDRSIRNLPGSVSVIPSTRLGSVTQSRAGITVIHSIKQSGLGGYNDRAT